MPAGERQGRQLPDEAWSRAGRHTEIGHYPAEKWLELYAEHLEANVAAWKASKSR